MVGGGEKAFNSRGLLTRSTTKLNHSGLRGVAGVAKGLSQRLDGGWSGVGRGGWGRVGAKNNERNLSARGNEVTQ